MRQSLHSLYFNHSSGSKSCNAINYPNKSFLKSLTRLVMYQSQNIENAVSIHKMGFGTSCLAYIMRGLYDILLENYSNYIFFFHTGDIWCRIQCNISLTCLRYWVGENITLFKNQNKVLCNSGDTGDQQILEYIFFS